MMKQEVFTGKNSIMKIKDALSERGIRSIFIVTGSHFEKDSTSAEIKDFLADLKQTVFVKKGVNVTTSEVEQAYRVYKNKNYDVVLGIGGGSVLDLAKSLLYRDIQEQKKEKPLFIAAPTTAGSGSEATCIAVVYDENQKKHSLENNRLLPDIAILDPRLCMSLSPKQTAISGIDAFCQAIESFWSIHATLRSRSFATEAILILRKSLPEAVHSPDMQIREKVLWASHLAGKAINETRTTGPHALSYFLSAHHNVPHGQAVALFLPLFFRYNSWVNDENCNHPDGPAAVITSMRQLNAILDVGDYNDATEAIGKFIKGLGLATTFEALGIQKSPTIEKLVNEVNQQRFKNNPVLFNPDSLITLCHEYL